MRYVRTGASACVRRRPRAAASGEGLPSLGVREISFDGWLSRDVTQKDRRGWRSTPSIARGSGPSRSRGPGHGHSRRLPRLGAPGNSQKADTRAVAVEPADAHHRAGHGSRYRRFPRRSTGECMTTYRRKVRSRKSYSRRTIALSENTHSPSSARWAQTFPRGKPQVFREYTSDSQRGISVYAFGKPVPTAAQMAAVTEGDHSGPALSRRRTARSARSCLWLKKQWDGIVERVEHVAQRVPQGGLSFAPSGTSGGQVPGI